MKKSPPSNPTESGTPSKNNNSALFGDDDDDSSEDDEFDGNDDGIVGKKGGVDKVIKPKDPGSGQTYNQKMGKLLFRSYVLIYSIGLGIIL